jgi:hypothetical protein
MLACTRLPVAEVGQRLGFTEPTNFGRFFQREVGCSPGAFRAELIPDAPVAPPMAESKADPAGGAPAAPHEDEPAAAPLQAEPVAAPPADGAVPAPPVDGPVAVPAGGPVAASPGAGSLAAPPPGGPVAAPTVPRQRTANKLNHSGAYPA